jgi:hypothetical protein
LQRYKRIQASKQLVNITSRANFFNVPLSCKQNELTFGLKLSLTKCSKLSKQRAIFFPAKFKKSLLEKLIKDRQLLNSCLRKLLYRNSYLKHRNKHWHYPYLSRTNKLVHTRKLPKNKKKQLNCFLITLAQSNISLPGKYFFNKRFGIIKTRSHLVFLLRHLGSKIKKTKAQQLKTIRGKRCHRIRKLLYCRIPTVITRSSNIKKRNFSLCKFSKNDYKTKRYRKLKHFSVKRYVRLRIKKCRKKLFRFSSFKINSR